MKAYKGVIMIQLTDECGKQFGGVVEVELKEEKPGEIPTSDIALLMAVASAGELAEEKLRAGEKPVNATQKLMAHLQRKGKTKGQ